MRLPPRDAAAAGAVDDAMLFVVERDNHRVQRIGLPSLSPIDVFGTGDLSRPYGVAVYAEAGESTRIYVTDNGDDATRRVLCYESAESASGGDIWPPPRVVGGGGTSSGRGLMRFVESVVASPDGALVLACDEDDSSRNVKVFTVQLDFVDTFAEGYIHTEPEGMVWWRRGGAPDGKGSDSGPGSRDVVIVTDQAERLSTFHLFAAGTWKHLGAFTGSPTIANTDGIAICQTRGDGDAGWLFAVHDDSVIVAYRLADIAEAVRLPAYEGALRGGGAALSSKPVATRPGAVETTASQSATSDRPGGASP
jgi:3-phytase